MPKSIKSTDQQSQVALQASLKQLILKHGIFNFTRAMSLAVENVGTDEAIKSNFTRKDDVRADWFAIYSAANQLATLAAVSRRSQGRNGL